MQRPLIGITCDNKTGAPPPGAYESGVRYARFVAEAGGLPVILPQEVDLVPDYVARMDGFVLAGGDDIDTRPRGIPIHPKAELMDPRRQAFETALLDALRDRPGMAVFGICLGMQMMAFHAGGRMIQHLPDVLGEERGQAHRKNNRHPVVLDLRHPALPAADGTVVSAHHQAVEDPAHLRVLAHAPDGTIEALHDPSRRFYFGVQWHPERGLLEEGDGEGLNLAPFRAFVDAARATR